MTMPAPRGNAGNVLYNPGAIYTALLNTTEPADLRSAWPAGWVARGYTDAGSQFDYQLTTAEIRVEEELDTLAYPPQTRKMAVKFALAEMTAANIDVAYNGGVITPASSSADTLGAAIAQGDIVNQVTLGTALAADVYPGDTIVAGAAGSVDTFVVSTHTVTGQTVVPVQQQIALHAHANASAVTIFSGVVFYEPPDLGQETRLMIGYESEDSTVRAIFRRCINTGNVSSMFKRAPQKAVLPVDFQVERPAGGVKPFRYILDAARAA